MLSGHIPFHAQSRDDSAEAVMARIKGREISFNIDALNHISSDTRYVTKGKNSDKYVKIESGFENWDFYYSNILALDNKVIYYPLKSN
jgi:hypothetical protein